MVAVVVAYQGWGSSAQAWGAGSWGTDAASNLPVATAAIGNESVSTDQVLAVTGFTGSTAAGTAIGRGGVITSVTGLSATATALGGDEEHVITWSTIVASQTPSWSDISTSQTPSWIDL